MTPTIVRRAATAAASATIAAAGLLALGGTASATELPHSEHAVVSLTSNSRSAEGLGGQAAGSVAQVQDSDHDSYWARIHEARRIWVVDQVEWLRSHDLLH